MKANILLPTHGQYSKYLLFKAFIVFTILFFFTAFQLLKAQTVAIQSGNWNDAATWNSGVPSSSDNVVIANGFTVIVNTTGATCNQLIVGLGDDDENGQLEFTTGSSLTITNCLTLGDAAGAIGTLTLNNNAQLTCSYISEGNAGISGVYNTNLGTISFTASNTLPENLYQFNNLIIQSGTTLLAYNNLQIEGDLTINNTGTLDLANFSANRNTPGGTLSINSGGGLKVGGTGTFPFNYNTHVIHANSTIEYNGSNQTISQLNSAQNFGNLIVAGSGVKQISGNISIAGDLSILAGIFNINTFTANRTSAGGSLTIANGATLRIAGSGTLPANYSTHSIASGSTIEYRGTSAQNIAPLNSGQQYSNLIIINSVKTLTGDITVDGTLTFGGTPNKLIIGNNTITVNGAIAGSLTSSRNFSGSSNSNITLGGTTNKTIFFDQSTPGATNLIKNVVVNHTSYTTTLGNDVIINNDITFTAGKLAIAGRTITINGTVTNTSADGFTGSTTSKMIVNTNQSINIQFDQTIDETTNVLKDLTINTTGYTTTIGSPLKIADNLSVTAGTLQLGTVACNRQSPGGTLTVANGATLSIGGTNTLPANYTTHSIGATATIEYAGTTQIIANLNTGQFYGNLSIAGSGIKNLPNSLTVMNNLIFNGAKLSIGSDTLTISGDITNNTSDGIIGSVNSTIKFNSVIYSPTIYFDQSNYGNSNKLKSLIIDASSGTLTLGNDLLITNQIIPTSGSLAADNNLTLLSTASNTAVVATGANAGGYITGKVTVERYISSGRKWHFLSVATDGIQSINSAWQEGEPIGSNTSTGYGTWITSPDASATSLGFDARTAGVSLKKYNSSDNTWIPVATTYDAISSDEGYMVFIRGDRACTSNNRDVSTTILRTTGTLKQGDQSAINVSAGTNKSIANVYPCAIDFRNINKSSQINDAFYVWDPKLAGSQGLGGYQTFTLSGGNYTVTPGGGSYGASGSVCNTIQPGQAFFVYAGGGNGTLQLIESAKTTGNLLVSKSINNLQLVKINLLANKNLIDGVTVACGSFESNAINQKDALKLTNQGASLAIKKSNVLLSVEKRKPFEANDTIFLLSQLATGKEYEFQIELNNFNRGPLQPFFEDKLLRTSTLLQYEQINKIKCASANGIDPNNRFYIVFKKKSKTVNNILQPKLKSELQMVVMPNPVVNKNIQLYCKGAAKGKYLLTVYNNTSQQIAQQAISITSANQELNIVLPANTQAGKYIVECVNETGNKIVIPILVQ
jgi:hypothetical protein